MDVEGEEEEDDTLEADGEEEVDPDEAEFKERAASTPKSLQSLDASLVPWYATPFRLNIPLLLD